METGQISYEHTLVHSFEIQKHKAKLVDKTVSSPRGTIYDNMILNESL